MTTDIQENYSMESAGFQVDVKSKKLVERPRIQLSSEKTELEGDGKDSMQIKIEIIDGKGKKVADFNGTIKISTNRGKLSERGGIVKMNNGVGKIYLTASNETFDRVNVMAESLDGFCGKGQLGLEFV